MHAIAATRNPTRPYRPGQLNNPPIDPPIDPSSIDDLTNIDCIIGRDGGPRSIIGLGLAFG